MSPVNAKPQTFWGSLFLLAFILSLPGWWVPYYNVDEITNSLFAKFIVLKELRLADFIGSTYLLTHYLYAAVEALIRPQSLAAVHFVNALWRFATAITVHWTGKKMAGEGAARMSALFYLAASYSFMSKDFHTPSAESFAILPAVAAFGCLFQNHARRGFWLPFLAGALIAGATLFKTPIGITLVIAFLYLAFTEKKWIVPALKLGFGFSAVFFLPLFLIEPFGAGFTAFVDSLNRINTNYIQAYDQTTPLYVLVKFIIRSALVITSMAAVCLFAFKAVQTQIKGHKVGRAGSVLFLFAVFLSLWMTVLLGKRIFYHYYVFWLAPLPLLAGVGYDALKRQLEAHPKSFNPALRFFTRYAAILAIIPALGFGIEGALNISTRPPDLSGAQTYIRQNTKPDERIYIWGMAPQLYFFGGRLPASTMFWSDVLAGASPGSPAMEYIRATGDQLTLPQKIITDLMANPFPSRPTDKPIYTTRFTDTELFSQEELLDRIDNRFWKKAFGDFFKRPPELFVDTSNGNVRGFKHYPLENYELLKRFVYDNYKLETEVNQFRIFRLK